MSFAKIQHVLSILGTIYEPQSNYKLPNGAYDQWPPNDFEAKKKISIHLVPINHNRSNGADNPILLTSSQIYQFS